MSKADLREAAALLGRAGGKVGGRSKSRAKIAAGRKNLAKARAVYQASKQAAK